MASRARDLANLAKGNLTIDASGDLDVSGAVVADGLTVNGVTNLNDTVGITKTSGYAALEMGGASGAYIDMKNPSSDDYDGRIQWDGSNLILTTSATSGGDVVLQHQGNNTKLRTTSTGVDVTGNIDFSGGILRSNSSVQFVMDADNNGGEVFAWGHNASNATTNELMRLTSAGSLGIGTVPNAASKLHVSGGRSYFASNSNAFATYLRYNDSTAGVFVGSPSANAFRVSTSSGATRLDVDASGNLTATGDITAFSDERLKSDITTIDGALDKVTAMRGVTFTKDGKAGSGVIAQELEKIAPELVMEGEEYKSVAYGNLVGYLIEAVKELSTKVEELENGYSNHRAG